MSLNFGRELLAIPGPSVMPDRVLNAMHRASPNIYEGELVDLTHSIIPDLKSVARTDSKVAIYIANGHGAWEAALRNIVAPGDHVLVLQTGRFGTNWGTLAEAFGIVVERLDFGMQSDVDCNKLEETLRADTEGRIKAVLTVYTDTSTSIRNNIAAMRKAIDAADHDALYAVDCIASLACDRYEMDAWGVDITIAACQKGLMTPAGLGFVYFNEKAEKARERVTPGEYWDWVQRSNPDLYYHLFDGTAPTHHLFGLREALNILLKEEGLENAWQRHEVLASAYWAAVEAWGADKGFQHNVTDCTKRSRAVSTIKTDDDVARRLRQWCEQEGGVTLGIGLGFGKPGSAAYNQHFRIGHMGHNNIPMVMGVIGTMDAALKSLAIPHGDGALEAASRVIAAYVSGIEAPSVGQTRAAASCCE